jgi:hypothetical protein
MKHDLIKLRGGIIIFVIAFMALAGWLAAPALAEDFLEISKATVGVDYELVSPQQTIKVKIAGSSHNEDVYVKMLTLVPKAKIGHYFDYGEMVPADDLYALKMEPFKNGIFSSRPKITVVYTNDGKLKEPYWFDWRDMQWKKLEASRDVKGNSLTFEMPEVEELIFSLFNQSQLEGNASWYVHPKYPYELMAASTDFPFGTKLKVTALSSGKEVIVTVKDYGPDKKIHPDRVIDLGKEAFKVLAPTGAGVIKVKVEPYQEVSQGVSTVTSSI